MNTRLITIDLDGTLLDPHGSIPEGGLAEIRRARAVGVEIVIATGRSWPESRAILEELGAEGVMIAAGGAMLVDVASGSTLERSVLPTDIVLRITDRLLRRGHLVHLLQDSTSCDVDYIMVGDAEPDPATTWWLSKYGLVVRRTDEVVSADLAHTVRAGTVGPAGTLEHVVEELEHDLGDQALVRHWEAVVENAGDGEATFLLEIFNPEVDKWLMVQRVLETRGLRPRDVVAIGDGLNDIHMLRHAGHGIAMGQAHESVRAVADHVVASNAEGGLAEAIRSVVPA
jgi:hypothetical protein